MITTYQKKNSQMSATQSLDLSDTTLSWVDLCDMTEEEERRVENAYSIAIPSKQKMQQIEVSKRFYHENNAIYIVTSLINPNTEAIYNHSVTFILHKNKLITVRYSNELPSFRMFKQKIETYPEKFNSAQDLLLEILGIIVERHADILKHVRHQISSLNQLVFLSTDPTTKINYEEIVKTIGRQNGIITKAEASVQTFIRAINFCLNALEFSVKKEANLRLRIMLDDYQSIREKIKFLSEETNFLLDASLGMIGIEHSRIVKLVSIVSLVFLPPTLIASIYGMNFTFMPELHKAFAYPLVLVLMIISSILPYAICRKKNWL